MNTKPHIIFVDDETYYARGLIESLADEGYAIEVAARASEAIRLLKEKTPDLIILDVIMPEEELEGTNAGARTGIKLLEIIRDELRLKTPIIFVTVVDSQEMENRIQQIESQYGLPRPIILVKVVLPSELLYHTRKILGPVRT